MTKKSQAWKPDYTITNRMTRCLMAIEAAKTAVEHTTLTPAVENELRRRARLRSTHFSTRIEGNRLTLSEVEDVIRNKRTDFPGRERDVAEVSNYWKALLQVEKWAAKGKQFSEDLIRRVHCLVMNGLQTRPTPYREEQNAIRDSASGALVYLPPEAKDVPALMAAMVRWEREVEKEDLPAPIIAGLVHYQFVTIHPYYNGNGRTARLLATFILHRSGYGLNGFLSTEELHARDLGSYYRSLKVHPHHNYYEGRAEADLTPWMEYFIGTLKNVFNMAKKEAQRCAEAGIPAEPEEIRRLDPRERIVLSLFMEKEQITSSDVAKALAISVRMARVLLRKWVIQGWLVVSNPSNRGRSYGLSAIYRQYVDSLSAMKMGDPELNAAPVFREEP